MHPTNSPFNIQHSLFAFPNAAAFGKVLNKERFYAGARNNRKLKQLFTSQVARVTWMYKLAPLTVNLPATTDVPEIEVIKIECTGSELDPAVLLAIDKVIPNPTIHELHAGGRVQQTAGYKRASEADVKAWVISHYVASEWLAVDNSRRPLPQSLNLGNLYAGLLRSMIDVPAGDGETLRAHMERHGQVLAHRREADLITKKMNAEKQLNRKVEWNAQLRLVNQQIQTLTSQSTQEADA
ncbi:DUF4391 domain-containing protein [Allorhodopirellula heiligendammensis]|uniref:DUF4391 domain-containing protein n=1 Tax=Allorhodopirellula heiligendammensis TaxID=2714739 RepID=A0A5C6B474_9BACT|nr:DUF4391 domain-containing protein [Allorhodopirellula heiligendammensis]TWU06547.1 hypothetical protein Poly21_56140 [Allorhodopirellula heiligendammensis]